MLVTVEFSPRFVAPPLIARIKATLPAQLGYDERLAEQLQCLIAYMVATSRAPTERAAFTLRAKVANPYLFVRVLWQLLEDAASGSKQRFSIRGF